MTIWTMQNVIACITGIILPYYCKYIFLMIPYMAYFI